MGSKVEWTLRLEKAKAADQGEFECQLSTSPKLSKIFRLNVVGKWSETGYVLKECQLQTNFRQQFARSQNFNVPKINKG